MKIPPRKPGIEQDTATVTTTADGRTMIRIELAGYVTPSLNVAMRRHWATRGEKKCSLAGRIALQLIGKRPAKPFARARLTIERYSTGSPDEENLWGGTKDLVDCLLEPGVPYFANGKPIVRHPNGLGIIADDAPQVLQRKLVPVRVRRGGDQKTVLLIEELA
ncbi:conserved protein of unknown function (plasmid) [Rhodovastum atsumiense]|uniref:Uncharacterized protein n=1 Tax=Rhodovastum atsumiense TaxID=504468 RepID=A0A5M6ITB9_9PROT|nr:hypothetical protein [Rhodovastum atsumiense]KAA5611560.1 hypothetical protein F1189_13425 [Rhodovastum atsumiense]CAH2606211.1 conserved protein of unknown function [Rhodovastum atsumiense]